MRYETRMMANEVFLPQVVAMLEEGHTVTLPSALHPHIPQRLLKKGSKKE